MSPDKKLSFLEKLTMMKLEESCPQQLKRFDELEDKAKETPLTLEEKRERNGLDGKLLQEYNRIEIHYRLNLPFMRRDVKDRLIGEVKNWYEKEAPN